VPTLTDLLGAALPGDHAEGRIDDLVADVGTGPPVVRAARCGDRVVPVIVHDGGFEATPGEGSDEGLWLRRDLLDVQVYDTRGKRAGRVGDVELAFEEASLRVTGVDVGLVPVLRRLKLGRLARRAQPRRVAWDDLHVLSERGHALQLASPWARIQRMSAEELAAVAGVLPAHRSRELFEAVGEERGRPAAGLAERTRPRRRFGRILRARRHAPS
jgi:hypothetical protein